MLESLSHCTSNTIEKIYLFSSPVILGGRLLPVDTMLEAGQPPAKASPPPYIYLFSDLGDMIFNRFFGDMERIGNLFIG